MLTFLKNLLIVVFLFGVVVTATFFSDNIRSFVLKQLEFSSAKVLGANTKEIASYSLSKSVKKELGSVIDSTKKQILQINIGDVVNSFSQAQKIVRDVSGLQAVLKNQLQKLAK